MRPIFAANAISIKTSTGPTIHAMNVASFTVNPFQENSYVLYDDSSACAIVDPGFSNSHERSALQSFIAEHNLRPKLLLNTHCHIDHILANRFVADEYDLELHIHPKEAPLLEAAANYAHLYNLDYDPSPAPQTDLEEGKSVSFGNTELEVLHIPGHAPGHVIFVHRPSHTIVAGDVIFDGSIGRTDLPGGNHEDLINSIRTKLFALPDDYKIYCGHGPETSVGKEKATNPFFQ